MKNLQKIGIVPVVVLENAEDALPLAERLVKGGLPCKEVTFRTAAAEESIRRMAKTFPEMRVNKARIERIAVCYSFRCSFSSFRCIPTRPFCRLMLWTGWAPQRSWPA